MNSQNFCDENFDIIEVNKKACFYVAEDYTLTLLYMAEVLTCYACMQMCSIIEVNAMVYSPARVMQTVNSSTFRNILLSYILRELFLHGKCIVTCFTTY